MKAPVSLLLLLFIGTPASSTLAQDSVSLKDTLAWMQNTLDSGAGSLYMSQKDGSTEKREVTLPGCEIL